MGVQPFHDKDNLGVMFFPVPVFQMMGRVDDMLHAVDDDGPLVSHIDDALNPEHLFSVPVQKHAHPQAEGRPIQGIVELNRHGPDIAFMPGVLRTRVVFQRGQSGFHAALPVAEDGLGIDLPIGGRKYHGGRVQVAQPVMHLFDRMIMHQINLGDDDRICHGNLFYRFGVVLQMQFTVCRIKAADHIIHIVAVGQKRIHQNGKQDRGRVCQTGRLDNNAVHGELPPFVFVQDVLQFIDQVLPHIATDTAAAKETGLFLYTADQPVVQACLAEFIDDGRRVPEAPVPEHVRQKCSLAAA